MEQNTATGQRIAIVTGGSRGIGRGVVDELTTAGYAAVVGYGSNHAEAEQVVAAAEAKGVGRPPRTAWHPSRHRVRRRLPRQPRRALDQRPDHPRQRRHQL